MWPVESVIYKIIVNKTNNDCIIRKGQFNGFSCSLRDWLEVRNRYLQTKYIGVCLICLKHL